uniref:Uncharacterized protein n=1 Tax=Trichobilharzia regenti TaxID=157069 RepID=A0AA85JX79_TRIRE|nr:unnamed protein product [Trichobilharzia regenti]
MKALTDVGRLTCCHLVDDDDYQWNPGRAFLTYLRLVTWVCLQFPVSDGVLIETRTQYSSSQTSKHCPREPPLVQRVTVITCLKSIVTFSLINWTVQSPDLMTMGIHQLGVNLIRQKLILFLEI